jgi:hypothetical protein
MPKSIFADLFFWDDAVGVYTRVDDKSGWNAMALLKEDSQGDQKVATEISLKLFKPGLI